MKRTVPLLITFVVGFVLILGHFTPFVGNLSDQSNIFFDILAGIAFVLGGGNLLRTHGEKVYKQQAGWAYSLIAIGSFLIMLTFGLGKVGVSPLRGHWTKPMMQNGVTVGLVEHKIAGSTHTFNLTVRKAEPNSTHDVLVADQLLGTIEVNEKGRGDLVVEYDQDAGGEEPEAVLARIEEGTPVQVGALLSGSLTQYSWITGEYNENGSAFWWLYEYSFKPLQMTTFAMLAFYVASAAFRAFRARNVESVLLLGTAFLILLGRTYAGVYLTSGLADPLNPPEGLWAEFLSFWYMPYLSGWFMDVWNTAGNRAIMIGIALGVASTSLKVLLGIDRSYLGSDKG